MTPNPVKLYNNVGKKFSSIYLLMLANQFQNTIKHIQKRKFAIFLLNKSILNKILVSII